MEMEDNEMREDYAAGEDGELYTDKSTVNGEAVESAGDSVDQMDRNGPSNGITLDSFNSEPNDRRATEDGAREDMFVDCPDEIENSESQQNSEEKDNLQDDQYNESDSGIKVEQLMAEMEMLRDTLDKSVTEKENLAREHEEEKLMLVREIGYLNSKIAELSESSDIAQSNSSANHESLTQLYEGQLEKDQHIEEIANRILASVSSIHHQEELPNGSLTEKICSIEKSVALLVEKYSLFMSESYQLRGCLNEIGLETNVIDENGTFVMARDRILELRRNEENLYQNLSNLENENMKLVEQLEIQRLTVENLNSEIGKLRTEVDQERNRYANTKEKLSMAVTKGKALVQHRDSLKQMLAEKTSQLETCSTELAEKEMILQKCREILSEIPLTEKMEPEDISEKLRWLVDENKSLNATSLQYDKLTDAMLLFDFPETVSSSGVDVRLCWLAESFYLSKEEVAKLQSEVVEIKEAASGEIDHLTTSLLAEMQEKSYLQAEMEDLKNKYEACGRLIHDLGETREAVSSEMNQLSTSLLAESQEKNNLQLELENLRQKHEEVIQKEYLVSLERNKMIDMLLEESGLGQEEVHGEQADMITVIDNCLAKIKENNCRIESSQVDKEIIESFKNHLYIKDQEMNLYKLIIEEDILDREQASHLSNELKIKIQELNALNDEKPGMQKSLDQLEDRCALLKDKLSMAVKKGKGLVQERENLKGSINEKNIEIDRLKSELEQNLSRYSECQDQITKLSLDVERIYLLEKDLVAAEERSEQLKQFLAESNCVLQRVMESVEGIKTPSDLIFNEPVEKVKWIGGYLSELETSKMQVEQELMRVKDEASSLDTKLEEVQTLMKSTQDELSVAENSRSQLLDEKKELEASKTLLEEELDKEREKSSSQSSKLEELSMSKRELENALSLAEDNMSKFVGERDAALESRALSEEQLQKLKDEFSDHIAKLADANETMKSLEDALSQAQKNISLLAEENSKVQIGSADLDSEMKKIREEAEEHARKFSEASLTIKSLEDALLNAENKMADLVQEKKNAEEEIVALMSKLESCMEELSVTRGSLVSRAVVLSGQLNCLQLLLKDDTLSSMLGQCFERKFESLNNINFLLKEMGDCFLESDLDLLKNIPVMEDDSSLSTTSPSSSDIDLNLEMLNDEVNADDGDSIVFHIEKMNGRFNLKGKILADKLGNLSILMDESMEPLLRRLHLIKDRIVSIIHYTKSLQEQAMDFQTYKQRQEDTIASLESDIRTLLSSCSDATQTLVLNVRTNVSKLRSIPELANLEFMSMDLGEAEDEVDMKTAEKLLLATRQNQDLSKLFQDAISKLMSITDDMRNKLKETQLTDDEAVEERDMYLEKISNLETDLEARQKLYREMKIKLDDYKGEVGELRKREAELSTSLSKARGITEDMQNKVKETQQTCDEALEERDLYLEKKSKLETELEALQKLYHDLKIELDDYKEEVDELRKREDELSTSLSKVHEYSALSPTLVKYILDKMNEIEVPDEAAAVGDSHDSADVRKLFYVIDSFSTSLQKISSLSCENEELGSTIDKQILEIEFLRKQVEDLTENQKDSEKTNKLLELESGLHGIVQKLRGNNLIMDDLKEDGAIWLLSLLDKLVVDKMSEYESSKSKNDELGEKLIGTQRVVDELSNKVKFLEDSNQARTIVPSDVEQGRGISIASLSTQTEISEMQEMASVGNSSNVPLVPSAAHVRPLRKGSSDHLAISIDSDSERLINSKESDEDKGHVFKSLNTTGLIPRQGRTVADRIDGFWVSGSRALMNHPRGRLGLIAYWLVLHIWLLGTIL